MSLVGSIDDSRYQRRVQDYRNTISDVDDLSPEEQLTYYRDKMGIIKDKIEEITGVDRSPGTRLYNKLPELRYMITICKDAFIRLSETPSILSNGENKTIALRNIENCKTMFKVIDILLKQNGLDVNGQPIRGGKLSRKKRKRSKKRKSIRKKKTRK
jgi:hypothetical protein